MLARKPESTQGVALPVEWSDSVSRLLNQTYQDNCDAQKRSFDVFGQIYPEELLVIVAFLPKGESTESATTLFLSCDKTDMASAEKARATQETFVDLAGLFFDEIFATEDWSEWEPNWQPVEWKGKSYYYKLTRENVSLSLEADRLLKEAGFDPNE